MTEPAVKTPTGPTGWWERFFFPETTAVRIAVMRIIVCATWLAFFYPDYRYNMMLVSENDAFRNPQALMQALGWVMPESIFRTPGFVHGVFVAMTVTGLFALIGLLTRPMLFAFACLNWFIILHSYSYGEKHHPEALFLILMMLLSFAPCGRALSVDAWLAIRRARKRGEQAEGWGRHATFTTAFWPLQTMMILIAMMYLLAGVCKLNMGGTAYFTGTTIQTYLLQDGIIKDRPLAIWLSQYRFIAILMGVSAIVFECGFPIILFARRLVPVFLIGGVLFHNGIWIIQGPPFFELMTLYLIWVPWDRLLFRSEAPTISQRPSLAGVGG